MIKETPEGVRKHLKIKETFEGVRKHLKIKETFDDQGNI